MNYIKDVSHLDLDVLFGETGAQGIRHRAARAIHERRKDIALIAQLMTVADAIETNKRHGIVADELRRLANAIQMVIPPAIAV